MARPPHACVSLHPSSARDVVARAGAVQAVFRIEPKMNKLEARRRRARSGARARSETPPPQVREYLEKIYGLPVRKVMTENFMGKRKRITGKRKMFPYARPNYKRAIVTFAGDATVYSPDN
jgi:large subunit ribosomal protein L23